MKNLSVLILLIVVSLLSASNVHAQTTETFWIQSSATAFKTNETVIVAVNAMSATPIQGFTAQIRYDPACLQPVNGTSPISGMNGLAVPQQAGLADVSFASTTPLTVNGMVAELRFTALKGCQTSLTLESAALVIRNEAGLAAPISGITLNQNPVVLTIDSTPGNPQPEVTGPSVLPLAPQAFPKANPINWKMMGMLSLAAMLVATILGLLTVLKPSEQ